MADEIPEISAGTGGDLEDRSLEPDEVLPAPLAGKARSLANLKPWKRGVSGNPKGGNKRQPLSTALQVLLAKKMPDGILQRLPADARTLLPKKPTVHEVVAFRLAIMAASGDIQAMRIILDRVEGRVAAEPETPNTGELDKLLAVILDGGVAVGGVNE